MKRSVIHRDFVIERRLNAELERVFRAWSDGDAKRQWSACDENMVSAEFSLDFRPGGREINHLIDPGGVHHIFEGYYLDIVENERIVYAYNMFLDDKKLSASIVTLEFAPKGRETLMIFTEQIVFLDGHQDPEERIRGTGEGFKMLDRFLEGET